MTEIASPTGTLVKREETSELTRISPLSTCISFISVKCLEFLTWQVVCPARGDMRDVMCLSPASPPSSHHSCISSSPGLHSPYQPVESPHPPAPWAPSVLSSGPSSSYSLACLRIPQTRPRRSSASSGDNLLSTAAMVFVRRSLEGAGVKFIPIDDTLRGALQPRWRTWRSPWLLPPCLLITAVQQQGTFREEAGREEAGREEQSSPTFDLHWLVSSVGSVCSHFFAFALMMTGAFSQNVSKFLSELKLVTDLPLHLCRSQLRTQWKPWYYLAVLFLTATCMCLKHWILRTFWMKL